MFSVDLS